MTEEEAREWVRSTFGVPRETRLAEYAELLIAESGRQNLIAASTLESIWVRHLVDSAQLVPLAEPAGDGVWLDIGSGAGLPGLVVALLTERPVHLIEPRAKRAEFLRTAADALGIGDRVEVHAMRVESVVPLAAAVITARAVMALPALLAAARNCSTRSTLWLLPKGRNAQSEVEAARRAWQGSFHVEPSITQSESLIVVAREVRPR
ncbi:16S rRNA (guanine(527)-N(7))-methyltransferase RsmG [Sphingosinithalassobacter sp. CS137]|uniref:16S rRNA (guanine(527)-N(7))-methyltransferase RsmG n=1 Tax=Sphingosinithalassobacter sp. CS137 TaxID=2762748 RepID=UPI00165E9B6A|nr:16S rRNA (guanine(527)-N(7))-methyltransferase RsmG [Sphingosinithalassobacter sp. CS137]